MTKRKTGFKLPLGMWVFIAVILIDLLCYQFSRTIPYVFNEKKILISVSFIFIPVLIFFTYFVYFYKWKTSGRTGFQMRYSKKDLANVYFKLSRILLSFVGLAFFSVALSWFSWGIAACGAYLYSHDHFSQTYTIKDLTDRGSTGVDVGLINQRNGTYFVVKQVGYYLTVGVPWKVGDTICIDGRESLFGVIADQLDFGACKITDQGL